MNQNDTYKCIESRTLKPECARPQTLATKNNKKIYGSLSTHSDLSILFVFDAIGILILSQRGHLDMQSGRLVVPRPHAAPSRRGSPPEE